MATTANNANTNITHSPRHSSDNMSSPTSQSRRGMKAVSSPWTQIVRGESEPIAAVSSSPQQADLIEETSAAAAATAPSASPSAPGEEDSSENGVGSNGNAGKRPAWNRPSNGVAEVGPVMGAVSWPALSESARAPSNKSSSDSLKGLSDGSSSVPVLQGTGNASSSTQKQVSNNASFNSTPNHTVPTRQRSMKRNGTTSSSNGSLPQPPAPQSPVAEVPLNNPSPRDHGQRSGSVSQPHNGNDHPQQRNSFKNRNGGPHPRGDGAHHQNYGNRRSQDHGNQDWNAHRNFNGRDVHMQPQRVLPRFMRHTQPPPPNSGPFMAPSPVRPFGNPMGYPVYYLAAPPMDSLRGLPFVAPLPPQAMYFPPPDPQLHTRILNQIDYYFSNENLIKDTYLRNNMDEQGWVPIKLIAGFNKVSHLTDNIPFILDALRSSAVVEVQGDKIRKRNDWMRWIIPPSVQFPNASSPQPLGNSGHDMLVGRAQNISLEQNIAYQSGMSGQADVEGLLSRSSSGDLNSQPQLSTGEGTGQIGIHGAADYSISARNSNQRDVL